MIIYCISMLHSIKLNPIYSIEDNLTACQTGTADFPCSLLKYALPRGYDTTHMELTPLRDHGPSLWQFDLYLCSILIKES